MKYKQAYHNSNTKHGEAMNSKIYVADLTPLRDESLYNRYYNEVPAYRRAKIDRYRQNNDRIRSLGAGLLLSAALRDAEIDEREVSIEYNAHEKPYLVLNNASGDLTPDFHFNLSHSGNRVICAVSDAPVGCDVETVKSPRLNIAGHFFCKEESEHIMSVPEGPLRDELFYTYWVMKESVVKATGLGLTQPFDSFRIALGEGTSADASGIVLTDMTGYRLYDLTQTIRALLPDDERYCYACCLTDNHRIAPKIHIVTL